MTPDPTIVSSYASGHLVGRSLLLSDLTDVPSVCNDVDGVITEAGWDPRCVSICEISGSYGHACLVSAGEDAQGDRVEHESLIEAWLSTHCDSVRRVAPTWSHVRTTLGEITAWLEELFEEVGRPLTLLLDLDALARYFSLGVLSYTHSRGIVGKWYFLYEEGAYGDKEKIEWRAPRTTWAAHAIPGMEGDWYPTREQLFLVSLGFDGDRVAQLIDRHDPVMVAALLGDPGVVPAYPSYALKVNRAWMERSGTEVVAHANAADAIEAWRLVEEWLSGLGSAFNPQGLLCGTKPHSLGIAIAALTSEELGVVYLKPSAQVEQRITPLGRHWIFELADRAVVNGGTVS